MTYISTYQHKVLHTVYSTDVVVLYCGCEFYSSATIRKLEKVLLICITHTLLYRPNYVSFNYSFALLTCCIVFVALYIVHVGALAHMADRKIAYAVIAKGGRIGVMTSFNLLMEDICLLQPTTFSTTPRLHHL